MEQRVLCIGGAAIDRKYRLAVTPQPGTSNPALVTRFFGGVARNVAENLVRLGTAAALLAVVGDDEHGRALIEHTSAAGVDVRLVRQDPFHPTAEYAAVLDPEGDLVIGCADMSAAESMTPELLEESSAAISASSWVFADCNLPYDALGWTIANANGLGARLAIDGVSEPKVCRLPRDLSGVDLLVLNEAEARVYLQEDPHRSRRRDAADRITEILSRGARAVVLTRGAEGAVLGDESGVLTMPAFARGCVDATGAGDALLAGTLAGLTDGLDLRGALRQGIVAAGLTVASPATSRPDLSSALIERYAAPR